MHLVRHVQVADCFESLDGIVKEALLQFGVNCRSKYKALLRVKQDAAGKAKGPVATTAQEYTA
jgi:hypothetical protein